MKRREERRDGKTKDKEPVMKGGTNQIGQHGEKLQRWRKKKVADDNEE